MTAQVTNEGAPLAAPISGDYRQFRLAEMPGFPPETRCWLGSIRPFASDESACRCLRAFHANLPLVVTEGTVEALHRLPPHWAEPLLANIVCECELLIVCPPAPRHPRAYLLDPIYDLGFFRLNDHPHPRMDLAIPFRGAVLPALCVYSASEFHYSPHFDRMTQFMDQVALWVARHLIWLKTRRVYRMRKGVAEEMSWEAGDVVLGALLARGKLRGLWPGPRAVATTPADHYNQIAPENECWCGSGERYALCHRPREAPRSD